MEGEQTIHARAAPLLSSITTFSAGLGVARIRQAWLPVPAYAQPSGLGLWHAKAVVPGVERRGPLSLGGLSAAGRRLLCRGWRRRVTRLRRGPATARRGWAGGPPSGGGLVPRGLAVWAGWLPTRRAASVPGRVPLLLAGWVQRGLREVGGPLDDQAGSLVGGAGDFRLGITCPTGGTPVIMANSRGLPA